MTDVEDAANSDLLIRPMEPRDAAEVCVLIHQLGYDRPQDEVTAWIESLARLCRTAGRICGMHRRRSNWLDRDLNRAPAAIVPMHSDWRTGGERRISTAADWSQALRTSRSLELGKRHLQSSSDLAEYAHRMRIASICAMAIFRPRSRRSSKSIDPHNLPGSIRFHTSVCE